MNIIPVWLAAEPWSGTQWLSVLCIIAVEEFGRAGLLLWAALNLGGTVVLRNLDTVPNKWVKLTIFGTGILLGMLTWRTDMLGGFVKGMLVGSVAVLVDVPLGLIIGWLRKVLGLKEDPAETKPQGADPKPDTQLDRTP